MAAAAILVVLSPRADAQDSQDRPIPFSIPERGVWSNATSGTAGSLRMGYGRIAPSDGSPTPAGVAVFAFRQDGVLISEAGVPASEPVSSGRLFAEVGGVVNTGVAFANPNDRPAVVQFYFTDTGGVRRAEGSFELGARGHIAKLLNAAPFNSGSRYLGTLTFSSSVPVAVTALRLLFNAAGELLTTTLPVAPLRTASIQFSSADGPVVFPHFADGRGWATQVVLVNPTDAAIAGTVEFMRPGSSTESVAPAIVTLEDGRSGSRFDYAIPAGSAQRFTTSNPADVQSSGSVRATPSGEGAAPAGLVVFSFALGGKTVSEAGVPALGKGTAFRIPVEVSGTPNRPGSVRTGLAVANTENVFATVTLEATHRDGSHAAPPGTIGLPPSGQTARMLDEVMSLPADFPACSR